MDRKRVSGTLGLLGESEVMDELRNTIRQVADSPYPVLVTGESGSGKELVARAVHQLSRRSGRSFGTVNCAALTEDLVEAELFGHTRGAFTGAVAARTGLFEAFHEGMLFLDEIGELSPRAQAKLLRVLQDGEIRRVGEQVARHIDVRVVAATNRPLEQEVAQGRFRDDLFYRLDVVRLQVPPCVSGKRMSCCSQTIFGAKRSCKLRVVRLWDERPAWRWPTITGRAMCANSRTSLRGLRSAAPGGGRLVRTHCPQAL